MQHAKMESDNEKTASVVVGGGGCVGPEQTTEPLPLSVLEGRTHRRGKWAPVAVSLVLVFIVTFSSLLISICKDHSTRGLRNQENVQASRLLRRMLSVSDGPTGGNGMEHDRFASSTPVKVMTTRLGKYEEVANSNPGFPFSLIGSDNTAGRRLSDSYSDGSAEFTSSRSHGMQVGVVVEELCVEAHTKEDNIFSPLLDVERTEEDRAGGESAGSPSVDDFVMKSHPELENPQRDIVFEAAIAAGILAPLDAPVINMDPATLPSTLLPDSGMLSESTTDGNANLSGTSAEGTSAAGIPGEESSSTSEWEGVQYAHLLSLWHTYTNNRGSKQTHTSPMHENGECVISLEALQRAGDSDAATVLSSAKPIDGQPVPTSFMDGTREPSTSSEAFYAAGESFANLLERLVEPRQDSDRDKLITQPWDWDTLSSSWGHKRHYTMRRVFKLRALLSATHLTRSETLQALVLGKQIVAEVYPLSCNIQDRALILYRNLASQLVHMVFRLDTLLWLSEVLPEATRPAVWWAKLIEVSNVRKSLTADTGFDSKFKVVVERSIECLRLLVDQKRPLPETIDWLMSMFKRHISKSKKFIHADIAESELVAETKSDPSGNTPNFGGHELATERQLRPKQVSDLLEVSRPMISAPNESGNSGTLSVIIDHLPEAQRAKVSQGGDDVCEQGDGDEDRTVLARHVSAGATYGQQSTGGTPQWDDPFLISSLANVPEVVNRDLIEATLLEKCLWDIDADDIAVSVLTRYSMMYPWEASSILSQKRLSLEHSFELLYLGRKIVSGLRRFEHWKQPNCKSKRDVTLRAKEMSVLVIQLDTVLRISHLFPKIAQIDLWWQKMVEKCNLEFVLQSRIDEISVRCVHWEAIQTSTKALQKLLQQTRPQVTVLAYLYTYYQTALKRARATAKQKK